MANQFRTNPNRQERTVAYVEFDSDSINESGVVTAFQVPPRSVITGGHLVPDGTYDATTATMSLGNAGDAARYLAATDVKAAAETALTTDGAIVGEGNEDIIATFAVTGTPTTGGGRVAIEYYVLGRSDYNHGGLVETP